MKTISYYYNKMKRILFILSLVTISSLLICCSTFNPLVMLTGANFFIDRPDLPIIKHELIPKELKQYIPTYGEVILIDYRKNCTKKRLWVVQNGEVVINCRVGHGKNSGWNIPEKFSNKDGSNMSCIGKFITSYEYTSSVVGRAMIIYGLEPKINDNANQRGIRFHSSKWASDKYFNRNGRIGRSLGCFTTDKKYNDLIIDVTKIGTMIYVIG